MSTEILVKYLLRVYRQERKIITHFKKVISKKQLKNHQTMIQQTFLILTLVIQSTINEMN
jgi:hypothetical protein